jgi:hypothetical protein
MSYKGDKYDPNLDVKDIAKLVRRDLKNKFPKCKFSVRIDRYSMGQSIDIRILETNFDLIQNPHLIFKENKDKFYQRTATDERFLFPAECLLINVNGILNDYRRDDSDVMRDYFNASFYGGAEFDYTLLESDREKCLRLTEDDALVIWLQDREERNTQENPPANAQSKKKAIVAGWTDSAKQLLVGKKIVDAYYMRNDEAEKVGWNSSPIVLVLECGTEICPAQDDEGNGPGALFTSSKELSTIPVISGVE